MVNLAATLPRKPLVCFWEITNACNLRCIHCEQDAGKRTEDELTSDEALALADDLADAGCQTVNLTGGEPLVRADWQRLARRLADLGLDVAIISNGLLVNEVNLSRMIDAGVVGVSVSIDGRKEVHDEIRQAVGHSRGSRFEAAERAIELLRQTPLKCAVITQIHKRNIDDLAWIHDWLVSLEVDLWQVQIALPLGRLLNVRHEYLIHPTQIPGLTEQLAGFIRQKRIAIAVADNIGYYDRHEPELRGSLKGCASFWVGCLAGCRVVAIRPNGDVKGCPSHPPSFSAGNIRDLPFASIWADRKRFAYNTEWDESLLEGYCARCPHRRLCRAGCRSMAVATTGTIFDNPFCVQHCANGNGQG